MKIETTTITEGANAILNRPENTKYYLVIKNNKGTELIINTGEKAHKKVLEMLEEEKPSLKTETK